MKETKLKFGVIGSGSWATALIKTQCISEALELI